MLQSIPKQIPGIDEIIVLIIDDGSTDRTVEVAKCARRHRSSSGTPATRASAAPSTTGSQRALELGADIVVNTDGDNQYPQERIADLVQPIIDGTADIVIADRQVHLVEHFSRPKVLLQKLGSRIVNKAAGTTLPDAASGFRAYSRDSLMLLNTITRFSYCMETIIQAGNKKLAIVEHPGRAPTRRRASRGCSRRTPRARVQVAPARSSAPTSCTSRTSIFSALAVLFGVLGLIPFVRYGVLWRRATPRAATCSRCSSARCC